MSHLLTNLHTGMSSIYTFGDMLEALDGIPLSPPIHDARISPNGLKRPSPDRNVRPRYENKGKYSRHEQQ